MMKFLIVASKKDIAGMNIVNELRNMGCKIDIKILEDETIDSNDFDKNLDYDFIVFASRHGAKVHNKTLTVHAIGNFHTAYGGKNKTIYPSSAKVFKHFFQTLEKTNTSEYKVTMETTHHGPDIKTPSLFIEIGSSEKEWEDIQGCKILAKTIVEAIKTFKDKKYKIAFGIGGDHYCKNFNKIQLNDEFAISHLIPSYALPIEKDHIKQILEKTKEKITHAIVDWKGFSNSRVRNETLELLKEFNLEIVKTNDIN